MSKKKAKEEPDKYHQAFHLENRGITRRQALKRLSKLSLASLGAYSLLSCNRNDTGLDEPEPPADFPFDSSYNVHSDNRYNGLQLNSLTNLKARWLRISIPYSNLVAARPFVGYGYKILGVITDHGGEAALLEELKNNPEATLQAYFSSCPSVKYWQILNEPTSFHNISPTNYVKDYLAPAARFIRTHYPQLTIVSAAPKGNSQGPILMAEMAAAGLEKYCDRVAVHIYNPIAIIDYADILKKKVWITETGINNQQQHIAWARDTLRAVREALNPERIFWYTLWDRSQYSLINIDEGEGIVSSTSPLYDLLVNRSNFSFK